ncbi:MAG: hypothetical protein Q8Q03_01435 [bacterium]|nr:hypothetical protein [bacterium]
MSKGGNGTRAVILLIVALVAGLYLYFSGSRASERRATKQTAIKKIEVRSDSWTEIKTDQKIEWLDFNPMDSSVNWIVVINENFDNAFHRKAGSKSVDYGNNITRVHLSLEEDGPESAEFILKRIPK